MDIKNQNNQHHARKTWKESLMRSSSSDATCLASQLCQNGRQETGLAIIGTGASRSVIGNDNVPAVLQELPESVRSMVKELPSRLGFRFGNNQIAYSFKQLQIPLMHGIRRVEVVPSGTPSIVN